MPHASDCPAPGSDFDEYCTCAKCELCDEPAQEKRDVNGIPICDECWPHLVRDCADETRYGLPERDSVGYRPEDWPR